MACVQIANNTPYTFTKVDSHASQMEDWGPFPDSIAPHADPLAYYALFFGPDADPNYDVAKCGGDVEYRIDGAGLDKSFHVHAGASSPVATASFGPEKTTQIELTLRPLPGTECVSYFSGPVSPAGGDTGLTYLLQVGGTGGALNLATGPAGQ